MRHGDKVNNLGRKNGHRRALLKNLSQALIIHKRINTTLAKAKALRRHIEPLITRSKDNSMLNRRVVFSYLQNKEAIKELFNVVGPAVADRPGGYVRVIRTGFRHGDAAEMAMIELVDFNSDYNVQSATDKKSKTRRSRRGGQKKKAAVAEATVVNDTETVMSVDAGTAAVIDTETLTAAVDTDTTVGAATIETELAVDESVVSETVIEIGDDPEMDRLMSMDEDADIDGQPTDEQES